MTCATSTASRVHYIGEPYPMRDRRRFSAWIEVERWHAWHPESI